MFRKELMILGTLAAIIFVVAAGAASFVVRTVQRYGTVLAKDTLPGLVGAGEAINRIDENWFNLRLLLGAEAAAAREELIGKIESNSTDAIWRIYQTEAMGEEDVRLFQEMMAARNAYLTARSQYFDLIRAGDTRAAKDVFDDGLTRTFGQYRVAATAIFKANALEGRGYAYRLSRLSGWVPYALGAFCVMVLLAGVFVGFKASLGAFTGGWKEQKLVRHGEE